MDHLILLADDNEKLRRSVADILQDEGYSVVEAATGKQALVKSARQQFDLLITDLSMPEMDGLQLLTEIKRTDPGLPVIAMSGSFSGRLLRFAATFGAVTIEKPFKRAALMKAVESALAKMANPVRSEVQASRFQGCFMISLHFERLPS